MNRSSVYIVEDRGLLYINGDDAKELSQALDNLIMSKFGEEN